MSLPPQEPATVRMASVCAGAQVGGYRLLRRLGAGGMGVVWEAQDADGLHVAMKILHPQVAADPVARKRLDREAGVLARVHGPRVSRVLDIESGDESADGLTFVVTELVDGPSLHAEVEREGPYELPRDAADLADLAHGLTEALQTVHEAGVVHRDLKPSNVMLGPDGPVLIDFGIAQVADDTRLTQTGQVTGTPGFIAPEMLDGARPDLEVDWYACAGVLLFAVTGRPPFGTGPWQTVFHRVYEGRVELGQLPECWPALAQAFRAALAPVRERRLEIEDLLAVIDDVAEGGDGSAVLAGPEVLADDAHKPYGIMPEAVPGQGEPTTWLEPSSSPETAVLPPSYGMSPRSAGPESTVQPLSAEPVPVREPPWRPRTAVTGQAVEPQPPAGLAPQPVPAGAGWQPGPGGVPDWAREPSSHGGVVACLGLFLVALGAWAPLWVCVLLVVLTVVAGTVGRAGEALRWRRLQRGQVVRGDVARMWALSPFYLLRSVLVTTVSLAVAVAVLYAAAYLLGLLPGAVSPSGYVLGARLGQTQQEGVSGLVQVAVVALGLWWLPGARLARRGAGMTVEALARPLAVRVVLALLLVAATAALLASLVSGTLVTVPGTSLLALIAG
ncbi:serine/threonine-protein kinase [Actinomyces faecalis]|uniref:serine/threonine-protein kinase n=1 Tax=Actinomyces faecalis TaxID=2722820 RepID=UPI00155241F1|nr:serine/threonine-protein kinase [Actinomyces faecalis]